MLIVKVIKRHFATRAEKLLADVIISNTSTGTLERGNYSIKFKWDHYGVVGEKEVEVMGFDRKEPVLKLLYEALKKLYGD